MSSELEDALYALDVIYHDVSDSAETKCCYEGLQLTIRQLAEERAELFNALRAACSQVDAIGGESAVYRRILDRNSTPDDIALATQQRKEPGA